MDENKKIRLRQVNYRIKGCGLCRWGKFGQYTDWGVCTLLRYKHEKHTEPDRQVSIHKNGECLHYESAGKDLQGFNEFIQWH